MHTSKSIVRRFRPIPVARPAVRSCPSLFWAWKLFQKPREAKGQTKSDSDRAYRKAHCTEHQTVWELASIQHPSAWPAAWPSTPALKKKTCILHGPQKKGVITHISGVMDPFVSVKTWGHYPLSRAQGPIFEGHGDSKNLPGGLSQARQELIHGHLKFLRRRRLCLVGFMEDRSPRPLWLPTVRWERKQLERVPFEKQKLSMSVFSSSTLAVLPNKFARGNHQGRAQEMGL